jgi:serine/threonine-protein kinase RsbT
MIHALSSQHYDVLTEDDIVTVRRKVNSLAVEQHFSPFAAAAITTATSELARNIWHHANKGKVLVELVRDADRTGLQLTFSDEGPGIADVDRVLRGGFSTANSMGMGLSGSKRLVDEFDLKTVVGSGTTIRVVKWKR